MLTTAIPKLPFIDKVQTLDYYLNQLQFELLSDYGDYFLLKKDGVELHFFHFPTLKPKKSDFMIYLRVDEDIDGLYQSYQDRKIVIHPNGPLQDKPWNQREFALLDPNGTLLTFGQEITFR